VVHGPVGVHAATGCWAQFYQKSGRTDRWMLGDKLFFVLFTDIVRTIEEPTLIASGSRIYYKFM